MYTVDFKDVSTSGLDTSPVAESLAGLRANEARYFMNKYKHKFTVIPASESQETLDYVSQILKDERDIALSSKTLETSRFLVNNIHFAYVFYEDGLVVNLMYTVDDPRAVGFKLSEGMSQNAARRNDDTLLLQLQIVDLLHILSTERERFGR